ncbi:MAG TPA: carbohydrate ABC transporter permease [Candidatus Limnocylindria bacterium]|nr:carbohydrate ABC transporter permease [Candidatus Limnocylindria bacterium]
MLLSTCHQGWPDVIFSEQVNDPVWMAQKPFDFAAPVTRLIPQSLLSQHPGYVIGTSGESFILSFATGTQLFIEPQLVNEASLGLVPDTWSSNQLAYQLAFRYGNFPGRRAVLTLTLVVMIMPAAALVLPIFLELNAMHLIGSVFSVILPFSFFPFGVYLAYIYYATTMPRDLLDAARVDGASEWQTFRRVALPLAKPIVALVFFFSFAADWNNFFLPFAVLADSSHYPIQVGLSDSAER